MLSRRQNWGTLVAVKNFRKWEEREPKLILQVDRIEGFVDNECKPWSRGADVQHGANIFMLAMAKKWGDKVLVSDDAHFATPEEKVVQDVRLAQSGPWRMWSSYHRQSSAEALAFFKAKGLVTSDAQFEQWVENSHEWAGRFKDFAFNTPPSLPTKFYSTDTKTHLWKLIQKHGRMPMNDRRYVARLKAEIELLHGNGTIDLLPYFFLAEEAISVYRDKGLMTGPGRGSAAGLLTAWLIGITHVDPIRYNLSLERFLTLDRVVSGALPDIDMDFPGRDLLVDEYDKDGNVVKAGWLTERFGDHYAQISTDTTLKVKNACKDVSRMKHGQVPPYTDQLIHRFQIPPQGVNDKDFVFGYTSDDGKEVPGSLTYDPYLQEYVQRHGEEWTIVQKCLGLTRQKSRHASAFVVMNRPVSDLIPLTTVGGVRVTQFTAAAVESQGGIKMDFLVVNSLKDISDAVRFIQERSGVPIPPSGTKIDGRFVPAFQLVPWQGKMYDVWDLPEHDSVFREITSGKTETVFQFNTPGAVQWLAHFKNDRPDGRPTLCSINDLATFTSLDRPGPLDVNVRCPDDGSQHNMLVEYARRVQGLTPSEEVPAFMNELFPETQGVMVYQEQLQHGYKHLTGCSGAEAEEFRRNVAKKKMDKVQKAYSFFLPRAAEKLGEENAKKAWEFFITFGKYGFNKSHAVCYALIGYVCAWLKHHYPLEWWCAVLRNADKDEVSGKFWNFCGKLIDLPDLTHSAENFEIRNNRIVSPIRLLNGVGEGAHTTLLQYSPYTDLADLISKMEGHKKATGKWVMKTKKNKKTGEESEVNTFQAGHCAVNRSVMRKLLIANVMDGMLPVEVRNGTVLDKLLYFEQVVSQVTGKKQEAVPEWYGQIGPLARYVLRRSILPVYSEDVRPTLVELGYPNFTRTDDIFYFHETVIVNAKHLRHLETLHPVPHNGIQAVAAVAHVVETRTFNYSNATKTATEMVLDVEGESFKVVAWPKRTGGSCLEGLEDLKGSVVVLELGRWGERPSFSVNSCEIIQRNVKEDKKSKEEG